MDREEERIQNWESLYQELRCVNLWRNYKVAPGRFSTTLTVVSREQQQWLLWKNIPKYFVPGGGAQAGNSEDFRSWLSPSTCVAPAELDPYWGWWQVPLLTKPSYRLLVQIFYAEIIPIITQSENQIAFPFYQFLKILGWSPNILFKMLKQQLAEFLQPKTSTV